MNNLALISPRVGFSSKNELLNDFFNQSKEYSFFQNLWGGVGSGLLIVAALTPKHYNITFIDENLIDIDYDSNFNIVGISIMTLQACRGYTIADKFRKKGIIVIIGGIHATVLPNEAKQHADAIVIGEVEYVWSSLLKDYEKGKLKPFYSGPKSPPLDSSPIPAYDLLSDEYSLINLQTSRGCPHDCEYCSASKLFGKGYRRKSIKQICREIEEIITHHGNKRIVFSDDNLFGSTKHVKELLIEIKNYGIRWHAQSDISIGGDNDLLESIYDSGCNFLFIGLESLFAESLKQFDKGQWKFRQLKNYSCFVDNIQEHGIGVMAAFIIGLDGDDSSVFDRIYHFVNEHNVYATTVTILTPFPGTRLRTRLMKENRLIPTSWDSLSGYNVTFIPKHISEEEIYSGLYRLYKNIYSKETYYKTISYFKDIHKKLMTN